MQAAENKGTIPRTRTLLRCYDLDIDTGTPSLSRGGQDVELRAKALTLLLFLVDQRDRIVSKDEIFERVWPGITVVDATLAGCIQEIRRALSDDAKDPRFIKTIPKMGYRFIAPITTILPLEPAVVVPDSEPVPLPGVESPVKCAPLRNRLLFPLVLLVGGALLTALAAGFLPRTTPVPLDEYPEAAWWKLNEGSGSTIADASGHDMAGTLHGPLDAAVWTKGISGGAVHMNGADQHISGLDSRGILPRGDTPMTLSAWVKVDSTNGDVNGILHFGERLGPQVLDSPHLALLPDGRPAFANQGYAGVGLDRSLAVGKDNIQDGAWHHLVGTLAGGRGTLYVDGVQNSIVNMRASAASSGPTAWVIGNHVGESRTGLRGSVDDVRVWRRPLRASEVAALHRCATGVTDFTGAGGTAYFFVPIFDWHSTDATPRITMAGSTVQHSGFDYSGVQLVKRTPNCAGTELWGADMGQDLRISVELLVPLSAEGHVTQAGPYFRSRRAAPGDGIMGGTSSGYWVQLHSTGKVTVKCLNPVHTAAFSDPIAGFDDKRFHRLEAAVRGETLEVSLDGKPVTFDQNGKKTAVVAVPPHWERPKQVGKNRGAAGLAFSSEPLRPKAGGQQARAFTLLP